MSNAGVVQEKQSCKTHNRHFINMWNAAVDGFKTMRQTLVGLIEVKMIRPDPIIKTSLHHLSCDKKVKVAVNTVTGRLSDRGLCSGGKIRERTTEQNARD